MNNNLNSIATDTQPWLSEVLHEYFSDEHVSVPPSSGFAHRCAEIGRQGRDSAAMRRDRDLAAMRKQLAAIRPFVGSFHRVLAYLAEMTNADLAAIFGAFKIARADLPDASSAKGLAKLAQRIGLSFEEAERSLRCGFAESFGAVSVGLRGEAAARKSPSLRNARPCSSPALSPDLLLEQAEASYTRGQAARMRRARRALATSYGRDQP